MILGILFSLNFSFTSYFKDRILLIFAFGEIGTKGLSFFELPDEAKTFLLGKDILQARLALPYRRGYALAFLRPG